MASDFEALLRVHANAFNAGDMDSLLPHYAAGSIVVRDGRLAGEGTRAVRDHWRQETAAGDVVGQLVDVGGQPAILEWSGPEGHRTPTGVVQVKMVGGRVAELHIDHREAAIRRLVGA